MELFTKFLNSKQKLLRINTNAMQYNHLKANKSNTNTGNMISSLMVENKIKKTKIIEKIEKKRKEEENMKNNRQ